MEVQEWNPPKEENEDLAGSARVWLPEDENKGLAGSTRVCPPGEENEDLAGIARVYPPGRRELRPGSKCKSVPRRRRE